MEKETNLIPDFDGIDEMIIDITEEELQDKKIAPVEEQQEQEQEEQEESAQGQEETKAPETVETPETVTTETATEEDGTALALYKTLIDKGILNEDKAYDGSWEKLDEYISELPQRIADDIIEEAPELTKKIIEFAFVSGENITKDSLKTFMKTYLDDIEAATAEIDVSTNESARAFLKEHLSKSLKPVAVEAALDAMEDDGSIIEEAKARAEEAKKQNNHQSLIDKQAEANRLAQERATQRTLGIQKELLSDKYSKEVVNQITSFWKNNDVNDIIREAFNNPKAFIQLNLLLHKYNKETKEFDFDSFIKEAATPAVNKIKNNILKDNFSSLPKTSTKKDVSPINKYESIEPIIELN